MFPQCSQRQSIFRGDVWGEVTSPPHAMHTTSVLSSTNVVLTVSEWNLGATKKDDNAEQRYLETSPNWLDPHYRGSFPNHISLGVPACCWVDELEIFSQGGFFHLVHYWAQRPHPGLLGCTIKSSRATPLLCRVVYLPWVSAILSSRTFSLHFHSQMPTRSVLPNSRAILPPSNFATALRIWYWLLLVSIFKISNIFSPYDTQISPLEVITSSFIFQIGFSYWCIKKKPL